MKLHKFAERLGLTPSAISKWVSGSCKPDAWPVAVKAAKELRIDPARLMDLLYKDPSAVRAMIKALPD